MRELANQYLSPEKINVANFKKELISTINKYLGERTIPKVKKEELIASDDYEITFTNEDIRFMCEGGINEKPYDEKYSRRIKWTDEEILQWDKDGGQRSQLPANCILEDHPNRLDGIKKGWVKKNAPHHLINPLTGENLETDSAGHPLHPMWKQLLKYGIPAGHGFYFYEGNVGNVEGEEAAQDPFIFRIITDEQDELVMQILVGVRKDDNEKTYAFLGGMRDKSDSEKKGISANALRRIEDLNEKTNDGTTAMREAKEEGGIDLKNAPFMHIGKEMVLDPRMTLNTLVTSGITAFLVKGDQSISANTDEMDAVEWITITDDLTKHGKMFATHGKLLQLSLKKIYEETGIGVDKEGRVVKTLPDHFL